MTAVECFKYGEKGCKCRECPLWTKTKEERKLRRVEEEEVACVAKLREVQQGKDRVWRRSLAHVLRWKVQEHCREDIPDRACLLKIG